MVIVSVILLMIFVIAAAKRTGHLEFRQYLLIILVTLLQVGIIVVYMVTMDQPPTY